MRAPNFINEWFMRCLPSKEVCWINVRVLLLLFFFLEVFSQIIFKIKDGRFPISDFIFKKELLFEQDDLLAVVPIKNISQREKMTTITINNLGQRISSNNIFTKIDHSKIKVVCLGGSTTFGTGVTDENTYPFILQQELGNQFQVFNLGVPGYSTWEAIAQMKTMVEEIRPDLIIHYHGWNDIHNYHLPNNLPEFQVHKKMVENALIPKQYISECFGITKFTNSICNFLRKKESIIPLEIPDHQVDAIYQKHLETLQILGEKINAKLVFIPQVLNLQDFYTTREQRHWTPFIKNDCMPELIHKLNEKMEKTIQENERVVVVKSILDGYYWLEDCFVDEGHFSKKGNEKLVDLILDKIQFLKMESKTTFHFSEKEN